MMNKRFFILLYSFSCWVSILNAQEYPNFRWVDFQADKTVVVQGQGWGNDVVNRFDRLPGIYKDSVRQDVWRLSRNSSGIYVDFTTNSDSLVLEYKYGGKESLKNMSSIGVSGMDMYAKMASGRWIWVKGKYVSFEKDKMQLLFDGLGNDNVLFYRLYFPLYNTISDFQFGVRRNANIIWKSNPEAPIIIYGTSIAQGASASRAGLSWSAILGRETRSPIINLGFSGNGRLEKELVDLIAKKKASIYIIDCLPNLVAFKDEDVYQRLVYALSKLRMENPTTPIIFTEHAIATIELVNDASKKDYERVNRNFNRFIKDKVEGKDSNVYVLKAEDINLGVNSTIDGVHPSDLGMTQYAEAYLRLINRITALKK